VGCPLGGQFARRMNGAYSLASRESELAGYAESLGLRRPLFGGDSLAPALQEAGQEATELIDCQ
jgi:hypothetical protein